MIVSVANSRRNLNFPALVTRIYSDGLFKTKGKDTYRYSLTYLDLDLDFGVMHVFARDGYWTDRGLFGQSRNGELFRIGVSC